jgi:BMFP domain-containing protein YqiC
MGMFDQFKAAQNMMKNMSPDQIRELMEQAKESQAMLNKEIKKVVEEEIARRNLVSREEVLRLIKEGR